MKRARWGSFSPSHKRTSVLRLVPAWWLLRVACLGLLAVVALLCSPRIEAADAVLHLEQAEFLLSESPDAPPDSAPWKPQPLPDDWGVDHRGAAGYGWYRLRFDVPKQPSQPWAVYIPFIGPVGAAYLNGAYLGRTDKAESQNGDLLVGIPPSLLHAGANSLHVLLFNPRGPGDSASLLSAIPGRLGLSAIYVGEDIAVRAEYDRHTVLGSRAEELHGIFSLVLGLFIFLLWLYRRSEPMYGWFALAALLRAIFSAGNFVRVPPIPEPYWAILTDVAGDFSVPATLLFALRYGGWRLPRVERGVWLYALLLACVSALRFYELPIWLQYVAQYGDLPIVFGWLTALAIAGWRNKMPESVVFITAALLYVVTVIYDRSLTDLDSVELYPYRGLFLYAAIGWMLVSRFARSISESEQLNAELEQRVEAKRAELERNYKAMEQLQHQAAVVEERQRIMSDMHDGIGGHLISTLSLVEHGEASSAEVATALRECIDDLRLAIDSLEPTENDLLPVLGNLRYRLDGRLKKQGIALDWQVKEVPKLACLTPQNVLHILRILQEAFTNVLKHAHASKVSVETGVDGTNRVFIRVQDNGTGFANDHKGHGLDNMHHRAQVIGGELDIQPSPTGTTLSLLLPVS